MNNENNRLPGLHFHHIGLLTENMENAVKHYSELFGSANISKVITVSSQKVKICFVRISDGGYIELVQPVGEDSMVYRLLKKRTSYYHIGYKVADISSTVSQLEALNYKAMEYFNSEAFGGKRCIFLFSPEAHLIELMEQ